jgi:hypothetical protein
MLADSNCTHWHPHTEAITHTQSPCPSTVHTFHNSLTTTPSLQVNGEVIIMRPANGTADLPSFSEVRGSRAAAASLWQQPRWAKGVLVSTQGAAARGKPLHVELLQMTNRACPVRGGAAQCLCCAL